MIIGDPYKFAILSEVINEWNIDDAFCNGVLLFCVNGDIYPKEVVTALDTWKVMFNTALNISNIEFWRIQGFSLQIYKQEFSFQSP